MLSFSIGDRINHKVFGWGTIIEISTHVIVIFDVDCKKNSRMFQKENLDQWIDGCEQKGAQCSKAYITTLRRFFQSAEYEGAARFFQELSSYIDYSEFVNIVIEFRGKEISDKIQTAISMNDLSAAEALYKEYSYILDADWYSQLLWKQRRDQVMEQIEIAVCERNYNKAQQLFDDNSDYVGKRWYDCLVFNQQTKEIEEQLVEMLNNSRFEAANDLFSLYSDRLDHSWYEDLLFKQKRRYSQEYIKELLARRKFIDAEAYYVAQNNFISQQEYENLKARAIQAYFMDVGEKSPSDEQSLALAKTCTNTLVVARAGSGKTSVIANKAIHCMKNESVSPKEMLLLAFNKEASQEMLRRVKAKAPEFHNAVTFHSLAYKIENPFEKIVYNETLEAMINMAVRNQWDESFQEEMYRYFWKEITPLEKEKINLSPQEYYVYRRSLKDISLRGEQIKSTGEKWIADFLFEHGVEYQYERTLNWSGRPYRPDFVLEQGEKGRVIVIEHWGVDPDDPSPKVPEYWTISGSEYRQQMLEKIQYHQSHGHNLIQTSINDLTNGREKFEKLLEERLRDQGVILLRLPLSILMKKVLETQKARILELFSQYIQYAKIRKLKPEDIEAMSIINPMGITDERTESFMRLGNRVYRQYQKELEKSKSIDFCDLLTRAIAKVHLTQGNIEVITNKIPVSLKQIKWILIDEYQDFSLLFYELIEAIRNYNPAVKLFCVGDDWQAINGFAGSELKYFNHYESHFPDSQRTPLTMNYRSDQCVVECGNKLMKNEGGEPSRHCPQNRNSGNIELIHMNEVWVEYRTNDEHQEGKASDERFLFKTKDGKLFGDPYGKARMLKSCFDIVVKHLQKQHTVAILSRVNKISGVFLRTFEEKLKKIVTDEFLRQSQSGNVKYSHEEILDLVNKIQVSTVHSFKGKESDAVILTEVYDGRFPLIHPDSILFSAFGERPDLAIREERRLFYVGLTRAKHFLYILTDRGKESQFLTECEIILPKTPRWMLIL